MTDYRSEYVKLEKDIAKGANRAAKTLAAYTFKRLTGMFLGFFIGLNVGSYLSQTFLPQSEHGEQHPLYIFGMAVLFQLSVAFYFKHFSLPKTKDNFKKFTEEVGVKHKRLNDVKVKLLEETLGMRVLNAEFLDKEFKFTPDQLAGKSIVYTDVNNEKFADDDHAFPPSLVTVKDSDGYLKKLLVTFDEEGKVYYSFYNEGESGFEAIKTS